MSTLGSRIKDAREKKNLYQSQLAELIGVKSGAVISNWEKDINKPDAEKIVKLCEVLGVPASYLLDYAGREPVLTDAERRLLDLFRQLPESGQYEVIGYARRTLEEYRKEKESPSATA